MYNLYQLSLIVVLNLLIMHLLKRICSRLIPTCSMTAIHFAGQTSASGSLVGNLSTCTAIHGSWTGVQTECQTSPWCQSSISLKYQNNYYFSSIFSEDGCCTRHTPHKTRRVRLPFNIFFSLSCNSEWKLFNFPWNYL